MTSIKDNTRKLLKLKTSNIMHSSDIIFNPEYFILDRESHLVYRREEIFLMLQEVGFKILESQYVQASHWDAPLEPTDLKAKEILVIVEKEA